MIKNFLKRTKNTEPKVQKEQPPKTFVVIFGLFLALSTFNLINDLGTFGTIKPFGMFEEIWAAVRKVTQDPAANAGTLSNWIAADGRISTSIDRCEVIDPNLEKIMSARAYEAKTNLSLQGENPAGLNQAVIIDGSSTDVSEQISAAKRLGFSYILGMVTSPSSTGGAIDFVNQSNSNGLIPIVRMCFAFEAGCDPAFKDQNNIVSFYTTIGQSVAEPFVAMVGPNEPGTGDTGGPGTRKEMYGFVPNSGDLSTDYDVLARETNEVAMSLQNLREQGIVLLSPGAFNIGNFESDDTAELLYRGETLDLSLFDVLMGNTYAVHNDVREPYDMYQYGAFNYATGGVYDTGESLKAAVDAAGGDIKVIITEFGIIEGDGSSRGDLIGRAQINFAKFCEDENVEGVMFFRSVQGLPETLPAHGLTDQEIKYIIGNCSVASDELDDYAWANCSLDTTLYDDEYSRKSTAQICGADEEADLGTGYYLRLQCNGQECNAKRQYTVSVKMPIKQFGSIHPSGAPAFNYEPISVEYAFKGFGLESYDEEKDRMISNDALNQFAGKIVTKGGNEIYPMPWLGNAINVSSQLIKTDQIFTTDEEVLEIGIVASKGSSLEERIADVDRYAENPVVYSTAENQEMQDAWEERSLDDERSVCIDLNGRTACYSLGDSKESRRLLRSFRPYEVVAKYQKVNECKNSNLIVRPEKYNYIEGPEIKQGGLETIEVRAGDACREFMGRATDQFTDPEFYFEDPQGIKCNFNGGGQVRRLQSVNGGALSCAELRNSNVAIDPNIGVISLQPYKNCTNGTGSVFDPAISDPGNCVIRQEISGCFDIATQQAVEENAVGKEELVGEVYLVQNPSDKIYKDVKDYEIPGIYDSLYWMYKRNILQMSSMNKRIVAKDNIGWEVDVTSNVRDANRPLSKGSDFSGASAASLEYKYALDTNADNIFKNEYYYAKGDPNQTEKHYYDWLGYVDILQEVQVAYQTSQILPDTSPVPANKFWKGTTVSRGSLPGLLREKLYLPDVPLTINDDLELVIDSSRLVESEYWSSYDLAAKNMRNPMFTCDTVLRAQVEWLHANRQPIEDMQHIFSGVKRFKLPDPTCISLNDEKNATIWREDRLAEFLCGKGYTELCYKELQCIPAIVETDENGPTDVIPVPTDPVVVPELPAGSVTCPLANGRCLQGTAGTFTHGRLVAIDLNSSDGNLYAPFDGVIKRIARNTYCANKSIDGGDGLYIEGTVGGETYTLFITHLDPTSLNGLSEGQAFKVGQDLADLVTPGPNFDVTCGADGRKYSPGVKHIHVELVHNGTFNHVDDRSTPLNSLMGAFTCNINTGNAGCGPDGTVNIGAEGVGIDPQPGGGTTNNGGSTTGGGGTTQYICETPTTVDDPDVITDASNTCNEFNCFIKGADNFEGSLDCASATLSNSITGSYRPSEDELEINLATVLDWYGPFCDNETSGLPFTHNWAQIYDSIAPSTAARSCSDLPPNKEESLDYGYDGACKRLPLRKDENPEAWEFFRGALETCGLTPAQLTWNGDGSGSGSVGSKTVDEVVEEILTKNSTYQGKSLNDLEEKVPGKLRAVVAYAESMDINPYLLIAVWGTESVYGFYDDEQRKVTDDSRCLAPLDGSSNSIESDIL